MSDVFWLMCGATWLQGLLSDDTVLAGALWRNFFEMDCADVEHIEKLVQYVRKQVSFVILDSKGLCKV